jgi:hypothetical protein
MARPGLRLAVLVHTRTRDDLEIRRIFQRY